MFSDVNSTGVSIAKSYATAVIDKIGIYFVISQQIVFFQLHVTTGTKIDPYININNSNKKFLTYFSA